ncbi:putative elongation factor P-like isoform 2 [Capsicum annuum]|nr:putative elongation factor P-like isoform 2 [Capsicum annuum]
MKRVKSFGKKGKLSPQYISPYQILSRFRKVAYELELPSDLALVHPVFHVSLLKKCIGDPAVVVPIEGIDIQNNLSYEEILVKILDYQIRRLRNKEVPLVKVFWRNQSVEGATLEAEADMQTKYPQLFFVNSESTQEHLRDEGDSIYLYLWYGTDTLPDGVTGWTPISLGTGMSVELHDVDSGSKSSARFRTDETLEKVFVAEKSFRYLYTDEETGNIALMEPETYEQLDVPNHLFGECYVYLQDDMKVHVQLYDERAMSVSSPRRVTCTVAESEIPMRASATPQYKKVLLDNGLTVQMIMIVENTRRFMQHCQVQLQHTLREENSLSDYYANQIFARIGLMERVVLLELQSEKRAKEVMEQLCDELARDIGEDRAEAEEMKRKSAKVQEEIKQER